MAENDPPFELSNVKVPSRTAGWNLDAWKYVPKNNTSGSGSLPAIVMAHGFSANKKMGLAAYAEAFVNKGYACVVFDYRRFGDSDGTPRECVRTSEQLEDYRTVIAWVRQQKDFDSERVILWGTSYSGGHAVSLASEQDLKLACAISQCPYLGKAAKPPFRVVLKMGAYGVVDLLRQTLGREPLYISAVAEPGNMGAMTTPECIAGLERLAENKRDYPNRITASSMFEFPFYKPSSKASKICCPLLLVIAEKDELCPIEFALNAVRASKNVTETRTPGGHFDMYHGGSDHEISLNAQLEFIQRHVPITAP